MSMVADVYGSSLQLADPLIDAAIPSPTPQQYRAAALNVVEALGADCADVLAMLGIGRAELGEGT